MSTKEKAGLLLFIAGMASLTRNQIMEIEPSIFDILAVLFGVVLLMIAKEE